MNGLLLPPRGAISRPPIQPDKGHLACWWSIRNQLDPGFLQVSLAEPYTATGPHGYELPRRAQLVAGFLWTSGAQLRRGAVMLNAAANWLDADDVDHGDQLAFPIEVTA